MSDSEELLQEMKESHKLKLLGAMAQLSLSDRKLTVQEKEIFGDFAEWMGVEKRQAIEILEEPSNIERLKLKGLPERVRVLTYITGGVMVLADGKFDRQEKRDLAILASSLGIAPESARETIVLLKRRADLRAQMQDAVERCLPVAKTESGWQTSTRNIIHVLGVFFGVGLGVLVAPSLLPGAFVGFLAGALGGGLVGKVVAGTEYFDPNEYNFNDL
jgi:uncharacterized tellurite resistance protein B-like protein